MVQTTFFRNIKKLPLKKLLYNKDYVINYVTYFEDFCYAVVLNLNFLDF